MPQMRRLEVPGSLVHIMAHSIQELPLFGDDEDKMVFLSRFSKKLKQTGFQCYSWNLMDNHYHLFLHVNELPMSKLMRGLNSGYARYYNKKHNRKGTLFQNRFKSVLCQDQDYAVQIIKYIHLNPLRAGMVKSLEELKTYKWSGHGVLMGVEGAMGEEFQNRLECLRRFGENEPEAVNNYYNFLNQDFSENNENAGQLSFIEHTEIKGSCKGWPAVIGNHGFVTDALDKYNANSNRRHREADYPIVLKTNADKICCDFGITSGQFFKRGRQNNISKARARFCHQMHIIELLPLSVIARYLKISIAPVTRLVEQGEKLIANSS